MEEKHYLPEWEYDFNTKHSRYYLYRPYDEEVDDALAYVFSEEYQVDTEAAHEIIRTFDIKQEVLDMFYYQLKEYFEDEAYKDFKLYGEE